MIKAEFSASFLQSSVSHDPSEIILIGWFAAQETFIIIINVESCSACILETMILFNAEYILKKKSYKNKPQGVNHDIIVLLPVCDPPPCFHSPSTADPYGRPPLAVGVGIRWGAPLSAPLPAALLQMSSYFEGAWWCCWPETNQNTGHWRGTGSSCRSFVFIIYISLCQETTLNLNCRPLPRLFLCPSLVFILACR